MAASMMAIPAMEIVPMEVAVATEMAGASRWDGLILGMDQWLVAPANDGFLRGEYEVGAMKLFVSAGAGLWAGFAVRLGVPASIDLLVLRGA